MKQVICVHTAMALVEPLTKLFAELMPEVNEAMADCMAARDKYAYFRRQVEVLHEAYTGTHELMDNGKASYLEVLKAQESLLDAQLGAAMNMYDAAQAVIELYIALGGGSK